ncbi:MAG: DNA mismatch endonuclease Vsr [Bacteroidetes bacterium]|nr:DNA mismatch endonuclease Vsr [Bacteroidota bacterium]
MADTFSKSARSHIMRQVKSSRNKSTEIKLVQYFRDRHITGWRRNKKLFGKPDFIFPHTKTVIFVDGCFWHGHNCRGTVPQDNKVYWKNKIARNIKRDRQVTKHFRNNGWTVLRFWECQLKDTKMLDRKIKNNSA